MAEVSTFSKAESMLQQVTVVTHARGQLTQLLPLMLMVRQRLRQTGRQSELQVSNSLCHAGNGSSQSAHSHIAGRCSYQLQRSARQAKEGDIDKGHQLTQTACQLLMFVLDRPEEEHIWCALHHRTTERLRQRATPVKSMLA